MLKRKTPLRAKPKQKTAQARRYHAHIASLGCLVCGGAAAIHHVSARADAPGRITRNDMLVVPLCPRHHQIQHGPHESVEAIGHQGFYRMHGIDLYAEAKRFAADWLL